MSARQRHVVQSVLLYGLACALSPAHAGYLLEPPSQITTDRSVRIAATGGGQTVLVAWDERDGVYFRVSNDQGLGFQNQKLIAAPPDEMVDGLWLEFEAGTVPLISTDGNVSRVLSSLSLETDPFFPPPGLPASLHLSSPRLYVAGPFTSIFRYTHGVARISDACFGPPGLGCSGLRNLDGAMSADSTQIGAVWTGSRPAPPAFQASPPP